jgi:hypothetical protein
MMKKAVKFSLYGFAGLIILCLCLCLIITTQPFLKSVVIPILESSIDAKISTDSVYLSLLKGELRLKNFNIASNDKSYSIKAGSLDGKISLMDLYNDKITIPYLKLDDSYITVTQQIKDKTEQKNGIVAKSSKTEPDKKEDGASLLFDITDVNIKNLNFTYDMVRLKKEDSSTVKLQDFDLVAPKFKTGSDGKIAYKGYLKILSPDLKEKKIEGNFNGKVDTELNKDSYPVYIALTTMLNMGKSATPITLKLDTRNKNLKGKNPFTFYFNTKDLLLPPIFKALVQGSYSSSKGTVKDITMNMSGSDIENIDFSKNIKGDLKLQVKDLEIPSKLFDFEIAKLIFLPLYIIANLNDYITENDILPSQITSILDISNEVLDGAKKFNFSTGDVDLSIENGDININQFILKGGSGCPVRKMSFVGDVDLNYGLNVRTQTNITGIIIPLTIRGSVDNPKPLVKKMLPGLIGRTAENIVKTGAEVGLDLGKRLGKSAGNFIKNIPNIIESNDEEEKNDGSLLGDW